MLCTALACCRTGYLLTIRDDGASHGFVHFFWEEWLVNEFSRNRWLKKYRHYWVPRPPVSEINEQSMPEGCWWAIFTLHVVDERERGWKFTTKTNDDDAMR